jgi:hypothetical protein
MNSRLKSFLKYPSQKIPSMLILAVIFLSGCSTNHVYRTATNHYYHNPNKNIKTIGRVAVIELNNNSSYPQVSTDITEILFQALQKKQVFSLTITHREDPSWKSLGLESDSSYTPDQMQSIRKSLKCYGILTGTVTEFRPYPHMVIGLRLKLLDLRDGSLLWALEEVWDIDDKKTGYRIQKYYQSQKRMDSTLSQEHLASMSPLEFINFVCYEAAKTL